MQCSVRVNRIIYLCACVRACVRACARACVRACMCACLLDNKRVLCFVACG